MICSICKKKFNAGIRPDGLPNGVGFVMDDGKVHDVCSECVMKLGKDTDLIERAKVMEAVQTIMEYCESFEAKDCEKCAFWSMNMGCMFAWGTPDGWNISEVLGNG